MGWNIEMPDAEWFDHDTPGLGDLIQTVVNVEEIAVDTETTGLNVMKDYPLFWSLSWEGRRMCMPASTMHRFTDAFADKKKQWYLANAKYDMHMLAQVGIRLEGKVLDTQVMHALIYEEQPHGLKYMAKHILGWGWRDFFDTFNPLQILVEQKEANDDGAVGKVDDFLADDTPKRKRKKPETREESVGEMLMRFYHEDRASLVEYASNDAYGTFQIGQKLKKQLREEATWSLYPDEYQNMWDIFWKTEVPFTKVLFKCERNGLLIDVDFIKKIQQPVEENLDQITRDIAKITGRLINLKSRDELAEYFFDEKKYRATKMTKGGKTGVKKRALDADVLADLAGQHQDPVAKKILEYRDLDKLYGTYIKGLSKHLDKDNRIHCRLNQDVARTGRLSSSNPNLQNIPTLENDKHKIRRAFIAGPGKTLIVIDYAALEMRLLAAAAQAKDMIQVFLDGKDIHMGNAVLVFSDIYKRDYGKGFTYEDLKAAKKIDGEIKDKKRPESDRTEWIEKLLFARLAIKSVAFGMNYGMKEKLLANNIGVPIPEAVTIMNAYMDRLPTVKTFYASAIEACRQTLKSFTLLGRRRFLPEILSHNTYERFQAERQAVNNEIQGTAAEVAKMAMINCDEAQLDWHYGAEMLLQIHDELMFECPIETAQECLEEVKEWMRHPFPTEIGVPLDVSGGTGASWADAK